MDFNVEMFDEELAELKKKVLANGKKIFKIRNDQIAGKCVPAKRIEKLKKETSELLQRIEDIDRVLCNRYFQRYGLKAFQKMDREVRESVEEG